MKDLNVLLEYAICYESYLRYPTNVKLLLESVDWLNRQMKLRCKYLKIRMPRNKYRDQREKYYSYSRILRKSNKDTRVRTRSLLLLLKKLIDQQEEIIDQSKKKINFSKQYYKRIGVIKRVFVQQ